METAPDPLVLRLRARDADAMGEVYARYQAGIFRFLLRLSGQRATAEDLFQETWLAAARDAARLREDSDLEAWLFTVARNRFRAHRRAAMFDLGRLFAFARERREASAPSPEDETEARRLAARAEAAFRALSPAYREVLLLVQGENLPLARVAAVLGTTPENARQRLHRARAALAEAIGLADTEEEEVSG